MNKTTLSDLATIAREMAGGEGTICCGPDSPIVADTAYNLANSGHAFLFLPRCLIKRGDFGYNILVLSDKEGLDSCMQVNGPRQEFQQAIAELKLAVEKLSPKLPSGSDVVSIQIDRKTAEALGRVISHDRLIVHDGGNGVEDIESRRALECLKDVLNKSLYNSLNWL